MNFVQALCSFSVVVRKILSQLLDVNNWRAFAAADVQRLAGDNK